MLPILATLAQAGLSLVGNAVLAKGKEWVEEKAGVKLEPDMSSSDLLKLKQFEIEHEEELSKIANEGKRIDLETFKAEVQDRSNARDNNAKIATSPDAPWYQKALMPFMTVLVTVGFFGCMGGLFYVSLTGSKLDDNSRDILIYAFGAMTGGWMLAMNFIYGSSFGSRTNQDALAHIAKGGKT